MDKLRWTLFRFRSLFRGDKREQELDEELRFHLESEAEDGAQGGLTPDAARLAALRSLGNATLVKEDTRSVWSWNWAEQLVRDIRYGWRQLIKNKMTSASAILSLALAIGACTAAFRLIDALLLRPLPVSNPEQLYSIMRQSVGLDGKLESGESLSYPLFRTMRESVRGQAELIAISFASRVDLTYGSVQDTEKAYLQYVSGWMFESFGLQPATGRLLTEADDRTPGAHPYAVISHDYWSSRFARDPKIVGRTFQLGLELYEIVGVVDKGFTGTEPGTMVDIFVPTMMNAKAIPQPSWWWFRAFVRVPPGSTEQAILDRLQPPWRAFQTERIKNMTGVPEARRKQFLDAKLVLAPAGSGASGMQRNYRVALIALGVLVALVLLIAAANVANLMTARMAARAREMALRISIGAGRGRLVQLLLIESAWIALLAAGLGGLFAWWAAPFVLGRLNPADSPARLALPADWRVLGFGLAIAFGVTLLFGLTPALRASGVRPAAALKGGYDPHGRKRLLNALIAVQVAFCFIVLFVGGLFIATYERLVDQPTGFSSERLLAVETVAAKEQPLVYWDQVANHLRTVAGVEKISFAAWPLLTNQGSNGFISVKGAPPSQVLCDFLEVSPGWLDTMRIPLLDGRDLNSGDSGGTTAVVNAAFAKSFFNGENPIGRTFVMEPGTPPRRIVGMVGNARYWDMRSPMGPAAYMPFEGSRSGATFLVRTATANPLALAAVLRHEVPKARSEFRASNIRTQQQLVDRHTLRERLLAMLALFFSVVALVLAGVGLFGVLDYSVLQQQREIGIRIALGEPATNVIRRVVGEAFAMVLVGATVGLGLGMASGRYIETLLYQVTTADIAILALPCLAILAAALVAALPPVLRAVRLDPVRTLRTE